MGDDFHRPTLTYPGDRNKFPRGAYNATQVRLYGKYFGQQSLDQFFKFVTDNATIPNADINKKPVKPAEESAREANDASYISYIPFDFKEFGVAFVAAMPRKSRLTWGVIVGYAYEGHCYDLPKPKVMLLPTKPQPIPCDDCGYNLKNKLPEEDNYYRVWVVDKLDECIELDTNQGFVEQLVLEANLPGKRSPNMYAGKMMLGHRSGRLSE